MIAALLLVATPVSPTLPPAEQFSHASLELATAYAQCRNQGVGGLWLEGTDIRADVAAMIAARKAKCEHERNRLRKSMLTDLGGKQHAKEVDSQLLTFDAAIDESITSRISTD